jgi:hypothetical protein
LGRNKEAFLKLAKDYLMDDLSSVNDFDAFATFTTNYPTHVNEAEYEQVKKCFAGVIEDEINNMMSTFESSEEIRGYADYLREVAIYFGEDVSGDLQYLEERASDLEQEAKEQNDDDPYVEYPSAISQAHIDDIDALFVTLIDNPQS